MLQDTHWSPELNNYIASEWGFRAFFSYYKTNSRGVAILLNNTFEFEITNQINDINGNFLILELNLPGILSIIIGNVYGPNSDSPNFYTKLNNILNDLENPNMIIAGDWNLTLNQEMDNLNYINRNNPNAAKVVQEIIEAQKWSDYWRVHNQETKKFTWSQKTPPKYARLDFFLGSEELNSIINKPKIEPKWKSDHAPISINISLNNQQRGRGVWKFNNSLLINKEFNKIIKEEIKILKTVYAATPYNPEIVENLPNKDIELTISFTLFLETVLTVLRGKIIKFSAKKKAEAMKE